MTAAAQQQRNISMIAPKDLSESPTNPRKTFARMEELIASVKVQGVLSPLIVRRIEIKEKDLVVATSNRFEIVSGHRRFRAAKKAGLELVPCEVVELTDDQALEVQLTENLQRADLTDLEVAELMEAMQTAGRTAEQIAQRMGVSIGTVYSRLKLLALCSEARKALAEGKLPSSVAVPLARLPTHKLQASALAELLKRYTIDDPDRGEEKVKIAAREAIEFLQRDFCRALRGAPFDVKDTMLIAEAGACGACPKNSKCATPGLFDDLKKEKGQAFCTDVVCFNAKVEASWQLTAAAAEARGAKLLPADEGAKLFPFGELTHGAKYIELDKPNLADGKKRAWREFYERLPEEKRPQLYVVPDKTWVARELVEADKLREALAEAPGAPKWAKAETERVEKIAEARAEMREQKAESTLRERVILEAMKKMGEKLTLTDEVLRFVLLGLAERWVPTPVLQALEMSDREAYEKMIMKASTKQLRAALLMWGGYTGDLLDASDGYPAAFKVLAKANDVDVKAIEKAIEDGDAAEALMKKPAAKKGGKS